MVFEFPPKSRFAEVSTRTFLARLGPLGHATVPRQEIGSG